MVVVARLTHRYINDIKSPKGREVFRDTEVRGLVLTVTPSGNKSFSWVGRAKPPTGGKPKPTRVTIGKFPDVKLDDARTMARRLLADAHEGKPVVLERKKHTGLTLGQVYDWWMKNYAIPKTKRPLKRKKLFEACFEDWRDLPLDDITSGMIDERHAEIGEKRGKPTANDAMDFLQQLFLCAEEKRGWRGSSPVVGLVRFEKVERDRYLLEDEVSKFFAGMRKCRSLDARDWLLLCLWTGARKGNVSAMEWSEIEGDAWQIPAHKTKQKKSVRVPLPPQATEIIESRRGLNERWVFPSTTSTTGHYHGSYQTFQRIVSKAGLTNLRIHDLRRTLGSWQAMQNTSLHIIGRSLGHTSAKSTHLYARLQIDPIRAAVDAATAAIQAASEKSEK